MKSLTCLGALAISAALAGVAFAQQESPSESPPESAPREPSPRLLERFDEDGDGKLSDAERAKAREFRDQRRHEARPDDDDAPRRRGRPPRGPEGPGRDRGPGDRGPGGPDGPRGFRPPNPERLFNAFDEDKNGQLSRDEFERLMNRLRELAPPRGPDGPPHFRGPRAGGPEFDRDRPPRPRGEGNFEGRRRRPPGPPREGQEADRRPPRPESEGAPPDGKDSAPTDKPVESADGSTA
jgi:hypothetical protein